MRDLLVRVHGRTGPAAPHGSGVWWSNEPVVGYRMWSVTEAGLWGAKTRWTSITKAAVCLKGREIPMAVPHLAAHCGEPACGIYAMKHQEAIWREAQRKARRGVTAVGRVAMEGRVIEHTAGYRAASATITRLCVMTALPEVRVARLDDSEVIDRLCRDPATVPMPSTHATMAEAIDLARDWLSAPS